MRLRVARRRKQQGVYKSKDRGVRADAKREHKNGSDGETRRFNQLTTRESKILNHNFQLDAGCTHAGFNNFRMRAIEGDISVVRHKRGFRCRAHGLRTVWDDKWRFHFVIPSAREGSHQWFCITQAGLHNHRPLVRSLTVYAARDDTRYVLFCWLGRSANIFAVRGVPNPSREIPLAGRDFRTPCLMATSKP